MNIKLYILNGESVFPLRGISGGLALAFIAYLIAKINGKYYSYPIEMKFKELESINSQLLFQTINERLEEFKKYFEDKINNNTAHEFLIDGGDMGRGIDGIIIELK